MDLAPPRGKLLAKYFPDAPEGLPLNFAQTAHRILSLKQRLDTETEKELALAEQEEAALDVPHPSWNDEVLPIGLLRKVLSCDPANALQYRPVIQRALARLYALAWWGRGPESQAARRELEKLIPTGVRFPITEHLPEFAASFAELYSLIRQASSNMKLDFPREKERNKQLACVFEESPQVIEAALRMAKCPFVAERLSAVLGIPLETARKAVLDFQ